MRTQNLLSIFYLDFKLLMKTIPEKYIKLCIEKILNKYELPIEIHT